MTEIRQECGVSPMSWLSSSAAVSSNARALLGRATADTAGLLLAVLLIAGGCGEEVVERAPVVRPVKLLSLGATGSNQTLEFPGTIEAAQQVEMGFEVPGKVESFPVSEGQRVEEGTLLARLDARDYESERAAAVASSKAAKAEFERTKALFAADVVSAQDLEKALRNFEVSVSRRKQAEKAVEDTALRAPFDGVVAKKLIADLANVQAKQSVLIFQDDSSLEVTIDVPERIFASARPDLSNEERTARINPKLSLTSMPDLLMPARITEVAATADPATRTFEARLAFDPPNDLNVLPGMTATVVFSLPSDGAPGSSRFSIPATAALADEEGNAYVWKVDPGTMKVSRSGVSLGDLRGVEVTVEGGLANGDTIAISGVHLLREGMQVRRLED